MNQNIKIKSIRHAEQGRSMVEMLGVLAVIGVLSVAGIAGYSNAMNKHRANELLNEASKRAVVVAGQLLNHDKGNLSEFTKNTFGGAEFATGEVTPTNGQFAITISGVSEAVCQQMKNASGGVIKGFKPDTCADGATVILTYNNDMSTGDSTSDTTDSIDTGTCANGNVYLSYAEAGHECDTSTPQNMGCTKNSDCTGEKCSAESGKCYCELTGKWQNNCSLITGGTCETLDDGRETTYENGSDKKTFLVSSGYMSWWAAENWCKAHHKSLVSYSTVNSLFDCEKDNYSCTWNKFTTDSYWSNGTLPEYYWTSESYSSCYAWLVYVLDKTFDSGNRDADGLGDVYALCE